jgi:hypothetical protein
VKCNQHSPDQVQFYQDNICMAKVMERISTYADNVSAFSVLSVRNEYIHMYIHTEGFVLCSLSGLLS